MYNSRVWHHIEENHINFAFLSYLERQVCRERVGDMLTEKILYIAEVMNRHDYVPKMPNQSELDLIFDTSYPDVQPYLFRVR
jgi:autophagy-related protein 101